MASYRFFQVDAFAERALAGGPAAVMPLDAFLPDETMQAIAAENNLAETAFIVPTGAGEWDLRWFTPALEVPLCGHATLASAHVLFNEQGFGGDAIGFDTKSGRLTVRRLADGRLEMDFPARPAQEIPEPEGLAKALGARPRRVFAAQYVLAEFATPEEILALQPDISGIEPIAAGAAGGRGNVICAAPAAGWASPSGRPYDVVSRFFAPGSGVPEDPATGSSHCTIAPHFSALLGKNELACFQAYPGRGADITTRMAGDRVKLIGRGRTVILGEFRL